MPSARQRARAVVCLAKQDIIVRTSPARSREKGADGGKEGGIGDSCYLSIKAYRNHQVSFSEDSSQKPLEIQSFADALYSSREEKHNRGDTQSLSQCRARKRKSPIRIICKANPSDFASLENLTSMIFLSYD